MASAGEEEAAEGDLLHERGEEDGDGGGDPGAAGVGEEALDGGVVGAGNEVQHGLGGGAENDADADQPGPAAMNGEDVPLDAVQEGALPEAREEPGRGQQRDDVGDSLGEQDGGGVVLDGGFGCDAVGTREEGDGGFRAEDEEEDGEGEEEDRVAEVGDAARGAVVVGGVGIVLDVERLGLDDGFDGGFGGGEAHKKQ